MTDKYVHGMDWSKVDFLENYTNYQFDLISEYIGKSILEVGAGNGRFIKKVINGKTFDNYKAIEPSKTLFNNLVNTTYKQNIEISCTDLFKIKNEYYDTIIEAISHLSHLMKKNEKYITFPFGLNLTAVLRKK
jgi:phospholipid N-methyltransferase